MKSNIELMKMVMAHEGFRGKPYQCSANKTTVGFGRNLDDVGISRDEAQMLMINDLNRSIKYLDDIFPSDKVELNDARQNALIDMMYNLGPSRFIGFKKMIAAIYDKDFDAASNEMLDSKWAKQVGRRAFRLARIMRTGVM